MRCFHIIRQGYLRSNMVYKRIKVSTSIEADLRIISIWCAWVSLFPLQVTAVTESQKSTKRARLYVTFQSCRILCTFWNFLINPAFYTLFVTFISWIRFSHRLLFLVFSSIISKFKITLYRASAVLNQSDDKSEDSHILKPTSQLSRFMWQITTYRKTEIRWHATQSNNYYFFIRGSSYIWHDY